jgi:hypothetical protein
VAAVNTGDDACLLVARMKRSEIRDRVSDRSESQPRIALRFIRATFSLRCIRATKLQPRRKHLSHDQYATLQRAHTHCRNLAKQLTASRAASYSRRDGSFRGLNGNAGVGFVDQGFVDQSAAAPATVSGESVVTRHWSPRLREGDGTMTIREPGDLPSVVVTRERIGRGVSVGASVHPRKRVTRGCVRGDVPHAVTRGLSCVTFFSPPPPMCGIARAPLRLRAPVT